MTTTYTLHPLAAEYLGEVKQAARRLPRRRAQELLADIEQHLHEAIEPGASDAEVLTILDRLGDPEEIVEAEQPAQATVVDGRGVQEWAAIILLMFGGFIFGVGWLIGLILLWSSRCWKTWEKWLGTLVIPGGYAGALFISVLGASSGGCTSTTGGGCTGGPSTPVQILQLAALAFLLLGPLATAIFLAIRARVPAALR